MGDWPIGIVSIAGLLAIIFAIAACFAILSLHKAVHQSVAYQREILDALEGLIAVSAGNSRSSGDDGQKSLVSDGRSASP